jgi:hypothetical protein
MRDYPYLITSSANGGNGSSVSPRAFALNQFFVATTAHCSVVSRSIRVSLKPASFIQLLHSVPLYSEPPTVVNMLRLGSRPSA